MIRNFLFHRVNPQCDALRNPMDVQHFDRCIEFITRNYETVLIEDPLHKFHQEFSLAGIVTEKRTWGRDITMNRIFEKLKEKFLFPSFDRGWKNLMEEYRKSEKEKRILQVNGH